jgi:hypothetical protein
VRLSLSRSRKGMSSVVAEVLMVLIVIILSAIVYVWVMPTFTNSEAQGNSTGVYAEKFSTLWGSFATFASSAPETLNGNLIYSGPYTTCTGSITPQNASSTAKILVPTNGACVITGNVGSVWVSNGASLTVTGATINGMLMGNNSASVTLRNAVVTDWTNLEGVQVVNISGSSLNTLGPASYCWNTSCTDNVESGIYEGGRGIFSFVNNSVTGMVESEVSHQAVVTGNTVSGRLEIESADFGQITNNRVGVLDLDQNGIVVVSGNTVYGNDPYYPGEGILWGNPPHYNQWCAQGNNVVSGTNDITKCIGNIEIDVANTGSIPVNLVAAYMTNIPLSGPISWKLLSGGTVHNSLPITIPVGQSANVTMQWTPPATLTTLPWMDIYFIFVSSHDNFVDGHLYFGYNPALTITSQSRPENQICPPCY